MNQLKTKLSRTIFQRKYSDGKRTQEHSISSSDNSNIASTTNRVKTDSNSFTSEAFLDWEKTVYSHDWSIPFKHEELLGQCLLSATTLAHAGIADQNENCKRFMEILIPDTVKKLLYSYHVSTWTNEVQLSIFNMIELLIDLIAVRLSYRPVPVQLLETLAMLFDCDSVFQLKHKNKPYEYSLDQTLGDRVLATPPASSIFSVHHQKDTYGWLCQIINRFVLKNGIKNLRKQFQDEQRLTALEYHALLMPFVNCMNYLIKARYRQLFSKEIDQVLDYIEDLNEENFKENSINDAFELLSILRKIYSSARSNCVEHVNKVYLNLILKMVTLSNFDAKMNSLNEQLAKIIEDSILIPHNVITKYIIKNSILWKVLEGNIDQKQYMGKVRILMDFIAPHISKEEIEKIWKMQHGRSFVSVVHLFTLITSAAAKFNLEQINHLIGCIYKSWKIETASAQEKLIVLLSVIGRQCKQESIGRVLESLWIMAHENGLSRSMLDRLLRKRRISDLDPFYLSPIGNACLKLYDENCRQSLKPTLDSNASSTYSIIKRDLNSLIGIHQGDLTAEQTDIIVQTPERKPISMTIAKGTVEIQIGDITAQKVDVIVGSSSSHILKRAIMNAAGSDVQMAYAKEYKSNPDSLTLSISSGQLPCKRIFFVKWEPNTDKEVLQQSIVDLIWNVIQNIILSFAGINGTVYGFGVYFSSNATYSHNYAIPNANGKRFMFVSRVLVGNTILGNGSMKTRPVGFDSTTDDNHIFVTYHDAQAFAEYLITYK
ncbi:unnamed protein product [Rotaria sordida]|uniref:Uncharacterized protein n=1 Tax=Rotaria sordida TaxID=392033 RepID=A0A815AAX6_9BILA|nr:unnamed protein product [Rotaria sordida]